MKHKEGCNWESTYFTCYINDDFGDEKLTIDENGIIYYSNVYREDSECIIFEFCPLCGCNLLEEEDEDV